MTPALVKAKRSQWLPQPGHLFWLQKTKTHQLHRKDFCSSLQTEQLISPQMLSSLLSGGQKSVPGQISSPLTNTLGRFDLLQIIFCRVKWLLKSLLSSCNPETLGYCIWMGLKTESGVELRVSYPVTFVFQTTQHPLAYGFLFPHVHK